MMNDLQTNNTTTYPITSITPYQERELRIREMTEQRYMIEALARCIATTIDMGYEKDKVIALTEDAREILADKLVELVKKI